ncbi:MAG: ATP-binding protein [Chlamydiota bacterium]
MKHPEMNSAILELKRAIPDRDQIAKLMIGFCNHRGGKLIIGVAENREIIGISEESAASAMELLNKIIYEASIPAILALVYIQRVDDKALLVIEVPVGALKPYYYKAEGLEKGTYIRLGASTLKATTDLIEELRLQSLGKIYDMTPLYHAGEPDLKKDGIQSFVQEKKKKEKISRELLISYYLLHSELKKEYPTVAGVLLFGEQPQKFFPEAFIMCTHFKGVEGRDVIASIDCTGTLFEQFHAAFNFIIDRLSRSFSIEGIKRQEILEIPEEAIREVLTNAIVHRNYCITSSVKVGIYNDRIEFLSPGSFVAPITVGQLKSGVSYIRNVAICKVFREAGYIEKLGSGWPTIFSSYAKRNLKSPKIVEGENFIKCILSREFGVEESEECILDLFDTLSQITILEVMHYLKVSRTTAGRQLSQFVKLGKIKKEGKGRSTYYKVC